MSLSTLPSKTSGTFSRTDGTRAGGKGLMDVLLDTHVFLWGMLDTKRLSTNVRTLLEDPRTRIWVSPFSIWEILVLARKKKIVLDPDAESWVRAAVKRSGVLVCAITPQIMYAAESIAVPHFDPVDRFIASSALVDGLRLITADEKLLNAPAQYARLSAC